MSDFSDDEIERYARHIVLPGLGGPGQQKLKASRVLIIGAGGLGAPVALYLVAAGIGTLGLVDDDQVSLSNLQRQIIHTTPNIGSPKVDSAKSFLSYINPHTKINTHNMRINAQNALSLMSGYDIVVDGSDNFATRYLVSDAAFYAKKPLVTAAVSQFDGSLTALLPFENSKSGTPNPTYRCLFREPPPDGTVLNCEEAGIIGALPGIIGTMQAMEVIKLLANLGDNLVGRLMLYNALKPEMRLIKYGWDKANPLNGENPQSFDKLTAGNT